MYVYEKARLAHGLSHPVARSALDAALGGTGLAGHVWRVDLRSGDRERCVCEVALSPEGRGSWTDGAFEITFYAVPSAAAAGVRSALLDEGLLLVCAWMRRVLDGPATGRAVRRTLELRCEPHLEEDAIKLMAVES